MTLRSENGLSHFLEFLKTSEAITAEVSGDVKVFDKKLLPISLEEATNSESLVYLSANSKEDAITKAKNFAFVMAHVSKKPHLGTPNAQQLFLFTDFPEALLDVYLRQGSLGFEWAGEDDRARSKIHSSVIIEPGVVMGPDCEIGEGVILESNVRLGCGVFIGAKTRVGSHTKISDHCVVGMSCQIGAHNVIGGQGFGLIGFPQAPKLRPRHHVGRVVVEDYVRTGSFVAIDRAVFGETRIGKASCLDNVIQVAHNSKLGEQNVLCGFVGLAGSTILGDRVTMAGMAASAGHLKIASDVTIAGQTGVNADITEKGTYKGYPPRLLREALKIDVLIGKLPEFFDRLKKLEEGKS